MIYSNADCRGENGTFLTGILTETFAACHMISTKISFTDPNDVPLHALKNKNYIFFNHVFNKIGYIILMSLDK